MVYFFKGFGFRDFYLKPILGVWGYILYHCIPCVFYMHQYSLAIQLFVVIKNESCKKI